MLTPLQFKEIFDKNKDRVGHNVWAFHAYRMFLENVTESDSLTNEQWNNLVKVCSVIKAHSERFRMASWHLRRECGTTHCIAGWAVALEANSVDSYMFDDEAMANTLAEKSERFGVGGAQVEFYTNKDKNLYGVNTGLPWISISGAMLLSEYVCPFFYWSLQLPGGENPEDVIMDCLVNPVLEEARKESNELLQEFNNLVSPVCVVV